MLVVYGSQTGTAEDSAEYVCRECVHRALHSRACSMDSVSLDDIAKVQGLYYSRIFDRF